MHLKQGWAVAVGAMLLNGAAAAELLTHAAQVKRIPVDDAGAGKPVILRGVVTQVIPEWWGFSLQDRTDGVYISAGKPLPANMRAGDAVIVKGRTARGNFAPIIRADEVRVLGPAAMPRAEPVTWQKLATGACDNEYVEAKGVVRSAAIVDPPAWEWRAGALRLDLGGNFAWAYLHDVQALLREPLVDATVRVRGVCLVFSNSQRQFQGTVLSVARGSDLVVLQRAPQDPFQAPLQTIGRLFGFRQGSISFHRVKVQGIATLQTPGKIYVQDGNYGMLIRAASGPPIQPGDRVEAAGFPSSGGYSTELEDAQVRVIGHGAEPVPRDLTSDKVLARVANAPAVPNGLLVRIAGRLLDRTRSARDETLVLGDGDTNFSARLRAGAGDLSFLEPGSRVAVSGVCVVQVDDRGLPQSFELVMRSPRDVQVLQRPPLLTRGLALRMALVLLAFLAAAVVGLALLRRRVARQTEIMRQQFAREASLEQRYSDMVENASDLVYVRDLDGRIMQVNRGAEQMTGYTRVELVGMNVLDLLVPEERERARQDLAFRPEPEGSRASSEWRFRTKEGRELLIETKERFLVENGQARVECIGRDVTDRQRAKDEAITERNRLEEQLHHAQKLESVGQLAGGIAHDFNNLLTVISGYARIVLARLPPGKSLHDPMDQIIQAADRAARLTRQLLMFSRRQAPELKIMSLDELVGNLENMLHRLIGEDIELKLSLDAGGGSIRADPGHIEQLVMNLVVNAKDAMPEGGTLVIRTSRFHADEAYARQHLDVAEGDYVSLEMSDTGAGMTPEVRSRIFEPFFTTKEQGKGTGLGLSMVYGIIKQSGGAIFVDSEPGHGTTFHLLFPLVEEPAAEDVGTAPTALPGGGAETILVAEDESGVRRFIRDALSSHGYKVLEATNGREALETAAQYPGPIHLLLTDAVMPEMRGVTLALRFAELRPGVPVLHMSGYTDSALQPDSPEAFIQKPFTPAALLGRVQQMLRANPTGTPN